MPTIDNWRALREALAEEPDEGPWEVTHNSWECSTVYSANGPLASCAIDSSVDEETESTYEREKEARASYIAAADPTTIRALLDERDRLAAEVEALRADAERYRMIRRGQHWSVINGMGDDLRADKLDAAIDAARGIKEGGAV